MKIQNKKKLATSLGAAAIAATMLVGGGTFAYLESNNLDNPVRNTVANNKVLLEVTETTGDQYEIIPGTEQAKNPKVKIDNTVDSYLFAEVEDDSNGLVTWTPADGWTLLKTEGDKKIYYREVAEDATEKEFSVFKDDKISYDKAITNADTTNTDGTLLPDWNIVVTAQAIQKDPFNDPSVAYAVLTGFEDGEEPEVVSTPAQLKEAVEAGEPVVLTQDIVADGVINAPANVKINGNGHTITAAPGSGATRILNFDSVTEPLDIDIQDVTLDATGKERAISFYGNTAGGDVNLSNVNVIANMYAINVASNNGPMNINVDKMTAVTGWCAYQSWSPDVNATFTDCELVGNNDKSYNAEGWNNFSTLVLNSTAENNTVTVRNSTIEANATTGNKQTFLSYRGKNQSFVLDNNVYKKDGVELTEIADLSQEVVVTSMDAFNTGKITYNGTEYTLADF